jgi:hypothetical protein
MYFVLNFVCHFGVHSTWLWAFLPSDPQGGGQDRYRDLLHAGRSLRKAQNEIAEYHRFRELTRELVEVNVRNPDEGERDSGVIPNAIPG